MNERRYTEEEIATIFKTATKASERTPLPGAGTGLTLPELQDIAQEVGVSKQAVADAAARLDAPARKWPLPATVTRRYFGFPIAVGRTAELPHKLSDEEWDHLLSDLRATFDARGKVDTQGSSRAWRNGNLIATVETTSQGERFRLQTFKRSARDWMAGGLITLGGAASMFLLAAAEVSTGVNVLRGSIFLTFVGVGMFAAGAARLRLWAQTRQQQIDALTGRLLASISETTTTGNQTGSE